MNVLPKCMICHNLSFASDLAISQTRQGVHNLVTKARDPFRQYQSDLWLDSKPAGIRMEGGGERL